MNRMTCSVRPQESWMPQMLRRQIEGHIGRGVFVWTGWQADQGEGVQVIHTPGETRAMSEEGIHCMYNVYDPGGKKNTITQTLGFITITTICI